MGKSLANASFYCGHSIKMRPRSGRYNSVAVSSKHRYAAPKRWEAIAGRAL